MTIERFRDDYFFLSSMFPLEKGVEGPGGVVVPSVEHAYQAEKFEDPNLQAEIMDTTDGFEAKRMARRLEKSGHEKRPDWDERKVDIMRGYVHQKFKRDPDLQQQLLNTGQEEIVEGNNRNDTFWGVCPIGSRNGHNYLGRILMETREELTHVEQEASQPDPANQS